MTTNQPAMGNDEKMREALYPDASKAYTKWNKNINPADNPIIMADPCFEHFLAGYQSALSTLLTMTREELINLFAQELATQVRGGSPREYIKRAESFADILIVYFPHIVTKE